MATLTYNGETYAVDHAVKGSDYIHGYDASGLEIVSFEGIIDFAGFVYDGEFMSPESCLEETCNDVKVLQGHIVRKDGTIISSCEAIGESSGTADAIILTVPEFNLVDGAKVRFKVPVDTTDGVTLNVNSTGAFPLLYSDGEKLKAGQKAGAWLTAVYSSTLASFILNSKGGGGSDLERSWVGTAAHGPTFNAVMGLPTYFIKYV